MSTCRLGIIVFRLRSVPIAPEHLEQWSDWLKDLGILLTKALEDPESFLKAKALLINMRDWGKRKLASQGKATPGHLWALCDSSIALMSSLCEACRAEQRLDELADSFN